MTQRIFDVDNPQDIKDLFDILPDGVDKIQREIGISARFLNKKGMILYISELVAFNWRNKKEITRPVDESQWIGKLCWFWDNGEPPVIGILDRIATDVSYKYINTGEETYKCCRPVRRDEVQFAEDDESKE